MVKNLSANVRDAGDEGLIPRWAGSSRIGNGNPLQYSCLGDPMDGAAWRATVHEITKELDTTEHAHTLRCGYWVVLEIQSEASVSWYIPHHMVF